MSSSQVNLSLDLNEIRNSIFAALAARWPEQWSGYASERTLRCVPRAERDLSHGLVSFDVAFELAAILKIPPDSIAKILAHELAPRFPIVARGGFLNVDTVIDPRSTLILPEIDKELAIVIPPLGTYATLFAQLRVGVRGLLHALFAKKLGIAPVKLFFGEEQVFGSLHSVAQKLLGGGSAQQTWGQRDAERFLKQNGVHQAVFYTTSRHMSIISERPVRDVVCVGTQEAYVVCAPERWVKGGEQSNKIEEIILGSDIQALLALVWHLSSNCDGDMIDVAVAELQERENLLWGLQSVKTRIDSLILPGSKTRTLSQSDKEEFSIELLRYHLLIPLFERNAVLWGDIGGLLCVYLDYLRELTSMMNAPPFRKKLSENRESEAERTILTGAQELLSARIPSGNETKIW